jgi:sigma-E factor negative regulatory protein RseB
MRQKLTLLVSAALLLTAFSASAQSDAEGMLSQSQHAFQTLNYEISYIQVRQGFIEPVRLIHAMVGDREVAHQVYLNGPARELIRRDERVAHYELDQPPYSLAATRLPGMFDTLAMIPMAHLLENYALVAAGKSRVAGRPAQVMRVVPKHDDGYGLYIWLDSATQLPLRIDTVDKQGTLIEQLMSLSLIVLNEPTPWMEELTAFELPAVMGRNQNSQDSQGQAGTWSLGWMPAGMEVVSQDRHALPLTGESVNYVKLSDGLFDISVYANQTTPLPLGKAQVVRQGATTLHTFVRDGIEITVVGEIPPKTAEAIADSVRFNYP